METGLGRDAGKISQVRSEANSFANTFDFEWALRLHRVLKEAVENILGERWETL
jgi:hypothetical protein